MKVHFWEKAHSTAASTCCDRLGMSTTRIVIIDEYDQVRQALERRFRRLPNVAVVGSTGNYLTGVDLVRQQRPQVVLLELKGRRHQLFNPVRQLLNQARSPMGIIVLTSYSDEDERASALTAGASRYLLKDINTNQLVREIEAVANEIEAANHRLARIPGD